MYIFDDLNYAITRLSNTIITCDGRAVNVIAIKKSRDGLVAVSNFILDDKPCNSLLSNFDLTPVKLGFVNHETYGVPDHNVSYITRTPIRQDWRQGFRKQQARYEFGVGRWDMFGIAKTIENKFPKLDESVETSKKTGGIVAFTRDFAIDNGKDILYRGYGKIGNITKDFKYLLDNKFIWVEESLKAAI